MNVEMKPLETTSLDGAAVTVHCIPKSNDGQMLHTMRHVLRLAKRGCTHDIAWNERDHPDSIVTALERAAEAHLPPRAGATDLSDAQIAGRYRQAQTAYRGAVELVACLVKPQPGLGQDSEECERCIAEWEKEPGRTREQVVAAFDKALKLVMDRMATA